MIYTSARWADAEHTRVTGIDANGQTETVTPDYALFRLEDHGPIGFVNNGGVIAEYIPPGPVDLSALDQATLNAALAAEGSVVRALALVLLQEINTVRTKLPTPLPAYTTTQLVSALKAKMR